MRAASALALCAWLAACDAERVSIGAQARLDSAAPPDAGAGRDSAADAARQDAGPPALYIEAEAGELSGGFVIEADPAASNGEVIAPPADSAADDAPGSARARYALPIDAGGEYVIWGRIYAPTSETNRFWFQLDGGEWFKWRISVGEIWFWDDLHDDREYAEPVRFQLEPGAHELVLASSMPGVRLDRLYVTAAGDVPPGNDTPCSPPHSIEIDGACLPSCGVLQGTACGSACEGREPLTAYDCDVCCRIDP